MLNTDLASWTPKCSEKLFIFLITSLLLKNSNFSNHCHKQHFRNNSNTQYIENPRELDENIINNFRNQLAMPGGSKNIDELWKVFKENLTSAKKVLPTKHTKYKKDWVTKEIRQLTIEKADVYQKIMQHKQKNQSVPLFLKSQYVIIKK